MNARTILTFLGGALLVAACTNQVDLGDGDAGEAGGDGGSAGTGGTSVTGGSGGSAGACETGWADCDLAAANGCEVDLRNDPYNCGACAAGCPGGASCLAGACVAGCSSHQQCAAGQVCVGNSCVPELDAGDAGDAPGCATNQQCAAGQVCVGNVCVAADAGDAGDAPGCATNQQCAAGQVCVGNVCVVGDAGDAGDAATCAISQDCGPGEVCVGHLCVSALDAGDAPACASGWADCDGDEMNGCETSLLFNDDNCGACGMLCDGGLVCSDGVCQQAAACDPFTNTGCQTPYACVVGIPYMSSSDIYCRPAGNGPADSVCSPSALCQPGTTCVLENPNGTGHCRQFCDYPSGPHGCPAGDHCASIYHPSIGICVP